ncbi:hypothetical protein Back2_14780 [Nocardioides baekrokdamisoli]|uniref:Uncharacterized protein n=1 Tax=Nocardioides baekrokdamisoli TaxID=1804624 RepID=A0A3G9IU80_9ACTN|nr:hypothetical protein [Nocardioides baekrokdamisoli]BBH17191.1 hypothetical protein Back2_14780 [Nocardioides baekrokdamisoli]
MTNDWSTSDKFTTSDDDVVGIVVRRADGTEVNVADHDRARRARAFAQQAAEAGDLTVDDDEGLPASGGGWCFYAASNSGSDLDGCFIVIRYNGETEWYSTPQYADEVYRSAPEDES